MGNGTNIQKFILGTAQFGMDYGVTNISGKPSREEVLSIVELAWEQGVRRFDTAPGYGSELLIGEFVKAHGVAKELSLITKIAPIGSTENWKSIIESSIGTSLKETKCNMIDVLLFHDPKDACYLAKDPYYFNQVLKNWSVDLIGVSVYEPDDVERLDNIDIISAYQFPYNLLDRRFEQVKMRVGMRVGRSIFLQGLLASGNVIRQECPSELKEIQALYHGYLLRHDIDPVVASLSFVAKSTHVDYFVVGVERKGQLTEIFDRLEKNEEKIEIELSDLLEEFTDEHLNYLDPRVWQ